MMIKPIISVIMPVYNGGNFLSDAISSVLDQSFTEFEFIIINDGSSDGSQKIIERFAESDSRIKFINRENRGLVGIGKVPLDRDLEISNSVTGDCDEQADGVDCGAVSIVVENTNSHGGATVGVQSRWDDTGSSEFNGRVINVDNPFSE